MANKSDIFNKYLTPVSHLTGNSIMPTVDAPLDTQGGALVPNSSGQTPTPTPTPTGKTNEQVLAESTAVAQEAAASIGGTFTQGVGFAPTPDGKTLGADNIGVNKLNIPPTQITDNTRQVAVTSPAATLTEKAAADAQTELDLKKEETKASATDVGAVRAKINEIFPGTLGKGEAIAEAGEEAGLPAVRASIAKDIEALTALNNTFNLQAEMASQSGETQRFASGESARVRRQQAIEIGNLSSMIMAKQGNLEAAEKVIKDTIDYKYEDEQAKLDHQYRVLESLEGDLTTAQQAEKDARKEALDAQQEVIDDQKDKETKLQTILANVLALDPTLDPDTQKLITESETIEEALQHAAPSMALANRATTKLANDDTVIYDTTTGEIIKNLGGGSVSGPPIDTSTPSGALAGIAQTLTSKFSSKFQQEAYTATVNRLAESGDEQALADYVFSEVIAQIPDSEARKKAFSQYKISQKLDMLETQLALYQAAGGDTNIFKGKKEDIFAAVGRVLDAELRSLATAMSDTLDALARDRTGAVISETEEAFYDRLLPSTYKKAELNTAVIDGLKMSLTTDLNSALKFQLGGSGFKTIEPYLGGDKFQIPDPEFIDEIADLEFTDADTGEGFWGTLKNTYTNFFQS